MTLPSNSEKNSLTGNFGIHLAQNIHLSGLWEVALTEIIYPYTWQNFPDSTEDDGVPANLIQLQFQNGLVVYAIVQKGQYSTISQLIKAVMQALGKKISEYDNYKVLNYSPTWAEYSAHNLSKYIEIEIDPLTKNTRLSVDKNVIKAVAFSKRLAYMLGFESNYLIVEPEKPGERYKVAAKYGPNLKVDGEALYVYCNLIEPQLVGRESARLLRIVHVSGQHGSSIEKTFIHKNYLPLITNSFNYIHIEIKTEQNKYVQFDSGKAILTLHFRRKQALFD